MYYSVQNRQFVCLNILTPRSPIAVYHLGCIVAAYFFIHEYSL